MCPYPGGAAVMLGKDRSGLENHWSDMIRPWGLVITVRMLSVSRSGTIHHGAVFFAPSGDSYLILP
jgi:hypothetical protein